VIAGHGTDAISTLAAVALAVASLSACVATGDYQSALPRDITYDCQDGKVLRVSRAPDASSASVSIDGRMVPLQRMSSANQEKYGNGTVTLYLENERALVNADERVLFGPCTSRTPLPVEPRPRTSPM